MVAGYACGLDFSPEMSYLCRFENQTNVDCSHLYYIKYGYSHILCIFCPKLQTFFFSGDGDGKAYIWDWKTTKLLSKWKAHDDVCIQVTSWNNWAMFCAPTLNWASPTHST